MCQKGLPEAGGRQGSVRLASRAAREGGKFRDVKQGDVHKLCIYIYTYLYIYLCV